MAHILFVTQYYPPEVGADQTHLGETAAQLVRLGHRVTVLTTLPNYPLGVVQQAYRGGKRRRETIDGVAVIRVWSYVTQKRGFLARILTQFSFGVLAGILGLRAVGQPDVVIVLSPPLFTAISGRFLAWRKGCPFIFQVADLWPQAAIEMGVLRNRAFIWLAERLELATYRQAALIWAVTEGLGDILLKRGIPPERLFVLPIGANTTFLRPMPKAEARAALGWDDRFTVLYCGTIGLAQMVGTLLKAAEKLQVYPDIRVVLVGEGAEKAALMAEAQRRRLTNVTFLGLQPHERIPHYIAAADACSVCVRPLPLFEVTLPVKMYETLACGRPLLLGATGNAYTLAVEQARAAIGFDPADPDDLARAILRLRNEPRLAELLGQRGRAYMEQHLSREYLAGQLNTHINALLDERKPTVARVT